MATKQIFNTSAELDYPTVLPTLDLDFANSKTLDPRITFTRSSGGSYVGADGLIKLAGVNEARFDHDPYTGESLGLLIEEARTNLLVRSEEFDNAGWTKVNSSVTANATVAPDGTLSAENFIEDTSTSQHDVRQTTPTLTSGLSYTFSIFAKSNGSGRQLRVIFPLGTAGHSGSFNLNLGTATAIGNTITASIQEYQNGWYRCVCTATASSSTVFNIRPMIEAFGALSYQGDGTSGLFIWGAQLEEGTFPTSYIPTEGSTRTRAADDASITGKNFSEWYRQDEGTVYCLYKNNTTDFTTRKNVYSIMGNEVGIEVRSPNIGLNRLRFVFNANFNSNPAQFSATLNQRKTSFSYNQSQHNGCIDGILVTHEEPHINDTTKNNLVIGNRLVTTAVDYLNGTISRLTYYPKRLPNSQLITLTS